MESYIIIILVAICGALCVFALWQDHRIEQLEGYINRRGWSDE